MTREEAILELETMIAEYAFNADEAMALGMAVYALRPVSRERVERIRGEWKNFKPLIECQICGDIYNRYGENEGKPFDFCPACGSPITDEAVDMVMEKLEEIL